MMLAAFHGAPAARPAGGSEAPSTPWPLLRGPLGAAAARALVPGSRSTGGRAVAVVRRRGAGRRHPGGRVRHRRPAAVAGAGRRRLPAGAGREVRRIHVGRRNVSELKVDAVIAGMPARPGRPGSSGRCCSRPTPRRHGAGVCQHPLGELPERPPLMLAFPSALEDGWAHRRAAPSCGCPPSCPGGRRGPWDRARWSGRPTTPGGRREGAGTIARAGRAPAHRARWTGWPATATRTPTPTTWRCSLDQLLAIRPSPCLPGYRTPIGGLFLTGAGTHPGGGVTGIPGRNTAAVVLRKLGIRRGGRLERCARAGPASRRRAGGASCAPSRWRATTQTRSTLVTEYQRSAVVAAAVERGGRRDRQPARGRREAVARRLRHRTPRDPGCCSALVALGLADAHRRGYALWRAGRRWPAATRVDGPDRRQGVVLLSAWAGLPQSDRATATRGSGRGASACATTRSSRSAFLRALDDLGRAVRRRLPDAGRRSTARRPVAGRRRRGRLALRRPEAAVDGLRPRCWTFPRRSLCCASATPSWRSWPGDFDERRFGRPGRRGVGLRPAREHPSRPSPRRCPADRGRGRRSARARRDAAGLRVGHRRRSPLARPRSPCSR